jgi:TonB family protein
MLALVFFLSRLPARDRIQTATADRTPRDLIWLLQPGPGGGGGGGGNRMPDPPKVAERVGTQAITVPLAPTPVPAAPVETTPEPPTEPEPEINIPAVAAGAATETSAGVIDASKGADTASLGPGSGGGAGTGSGPGVGPGQGSGLGPGFGGGTGGGAYRPGNGVTSPNPVRRVTPLYTAAAMHARIQGTVALECIVLDTGSVGTCRVTRSLDSSFGLDDEAIKAAKQWRFIPGRRQGEPVNVLVGIELDFRMH